MTRKGQREAMLEGLGMPTKIRKRGCSSSPSSSSRICNYRFSKRAILVGKNRAGLGLGRSRSSTPVPIWRTTPLRSAIETPKYSQGGKSTRPVSARRLAATLWEMNEMPSPKMSEGGDLEVGKRQLKKSGSRMAVKAERLVQSGWGLHSGSGSGYLPPHLSDPPHSPTVSEKMDRSGTGSRRRRSASISQKLMSADRNVEAIDSISNASFLDVETRSRPHISSESVGGKSRLKDVSNALTTSKELLKIINRIWAQTEQPSSSTSLIAALHAELERARLQVNQVIQEQRSDKNDVNYLMKCFAEEKAAWKNKEQLAVESAIGSIAHELEVERKLRRRLESLNAKLGKELSEIKSSFIKAVKDLESEKRARELTEQVCSELARNLDEDRAEVEKLKRESVLVDKLHEERGHMKLSEEKNSAISKLRKQLEVFLGTKREKDEERATHSSKHHNIVPHGEDDGEVEDGHGIDDSAESDLHSIELDLINNNDDNTTTDAKGHKWAYASVDREPRRLPVTNETKTRNSVSGQGSRRSTSIQRSASDGVDESYLDEMQRLKSTKGIKNHLSRLGRENCPSPKEQSCLERTSLSRPRASEGSRRSKW